MVVALDWTSFAADEQETIVLSMLTGHGRATPLLWKTVASLALKGNQRRHEYEVLCRLRDVLPDGVEVTVVADRGFADRKLFYALTTELGFKWVRLRGRQAAACGRRPARRTRVRNVCCTLQYSSLVPAVETNSAAVSRAGGRSSRCRYCRTAALAVGCNGSARDLSSLPWRTVISLCSASKSCRSSVMASPTRIPVTTSSPIRVRYVAARCPVRNLDVAASATVVNQTAATPVTFPLRGIHIGGNLGTNTAAVNDWHAGRTDTIGPADYIAWLRRLQVSWVGISVALTYDDSTDSTVERNHDHAAGDDASFSDDALRQIISEQRTHGIDAYLTLGFETHRADESSRPAPRELLGDPGDASGVPCCNRGIAPEAWPWHPEHRDHARFTTEFWDSYPERRSTSQRSPKRRAYGCSRSAPRPTASSGRAPAGSSTTTSAPNCAR